MGLLACSVNALFNKMTLPNIRIKFSVYKTLLILIILSFFLFIGGIFLADEPVLAADTEVITTKLNGKNMPKETDTKRKIEETIEVSQKETMRFKLEKKKEQIEATPKQEKEQDKKRPELKVHFIDVGQADAALIEFHNKTILIDAGDWDKNDVLDYLKQRSIKKIDLVVGTHEHADHIGQIDKVIQHFAVKEVWLPGGNATTKVFERVISAIDANKIAYDEPRAGDKYKIGDLSIDILSPKQLTGNLNSDSLVIKLTYGAISFLFAGDAEKNTEKQMVRSGQNLTSTILKVGHHGSNTSTTSIFLNEVNPQVAVISVAKNSPYGHPAQRVIDRIIKKEIELYATKTHGNIIIETDGNQYHISTDKTGKVTSGNSKTNRKTN